MRFRDHSKLLGSHAFLSPSSYHWVNYSEEKFDSHVTSSFASRRGVEMHELAQRMIHLGVQLPPTRQTLNAYVNDAIGFRMTPEQVLYYSENCYGTTDCIGFRDRRLRIHDLKTGVNTSKMAQLEIYAAIFCLEYGIKPMDIETELRIYQNDEVEILAANPLDLMNLMDRIVFFDRRITQLREETYG